MTWLAAVRAFRRTLFPYRTAEKFLEFGIQLFALRDHFFDPGYLGVYARITSFR
jgi:hypothetical protein